MTMTVVFEDYEDMMNFAKKVMGQDVSSDNASQRPTAENILGITPETFTTASSLQPEQYGAFATALRGLGAQI